MPDKAYKFADPDAAFADAERQIREAKPTRPKLFDLRDLGLVELPDSIGQLDSIVMLLLDGNHLVKLPASIGNLRDLGSLLLRENRLSDLPAELSQCSNLRAISLRDNQFEHLPPCMAALTSLRQVSLRNNRLKTLPEWLRSLPLLNTLFLHGNPDLGLPAEILGPNPDNQSDEDNVYPSVILDYFFQARLRGRRPLNEAKLILLGRGETGKTSLVNRLVHDKFVPTPMTRGISITHWQVPTGNGTVRLHVWDFGGQEIQHATHQFFLTERSLYLVVLNGRAGAEDEDAEYWLKFIKTFGGGSPTIVVLNKFKVQPFQVNRRGLKEKYPFIRAFVETDCKPKHHAGIRELKRRTESALAAMDHVRADFPAGWFQIKERLAEMKEPYISFGEYRKLCAESGETDPQAQERLAGFLNALGIALNFRDDPQLRDETVLNPHWITEGVYRIITSRVLSVQKGELTLMDLTRIFTGTAARKTAASPRGMAARDSRALNSRNAYPPRMHGFLVELMRKFELCFPFQDDPGKQRYLVPELLSKEEPQIKLPFLPFQCLNFRYDYRLMPEGLLPRFITRTHPMSEPAERWRTGVVLRWEGCRALVKADKQERQVLVRVLGEPEKRRRLLAVIRGNFDAIHAEMREFKPSEWVALEGLPDEFISHRELEVLEQQKVKELPKPVGNTVVTVDVKKMLDETDVPGARQRHDQGAQKRPLKMFISYAREDERWRKKLEPNMGLMRREGLVDFWHDGDLVPSMEFKAEIERRLAESEIILFLVSVDMLNSDFIREVELPMAMGLHKGNKARVVPVLVRPCSWKSYFGEIEALPKGGRPMRGWPRPDNDCFAVEEGLRRTVTEVRRLLGLDSIV